MKKRLLAVTFAIVMVVSLSSSIALAGGILNPGQPGGNEPGVPPRPPGYCPSGPNGPCIIPW